ncbi:MAG TPA: tocopherol cyclase family protein [Kofleriaceae bacterium]|nr:tocopherol cyclase family protein [Kofleriaceae bacterium]
MPRPFRDTSPPLSSPSEPDNVRRWDGHSPGHREVWYLTLNHRESATGAWIRYTLEVPREREARAELWFAWFDARRPDRTFGIHRAFPISEMVAEADPFAVSIAGALLRHDRARGELQGSGHRAAWDLSWHPAPRTHRHLPSLLYRTLGGRRALLDSAVLSPNLDIAVRGWIEVDGRRVELDGEPGGQTHLWGRKHPHSWAWGHATAFEGHPGAALESLSARIERGGRISPPVTVLSLYMGGEELHFNRLRTLARNRGRSGTGFYRFSGADATARVEGEFSCRPEDMLMAAYEDPDGAPLFCANTEIGDLRVTVFRRSRPFGRWREAAVLHAVRTAHFEVASRERDPAIGKLHTRL